ncbi:D-amino-acid N-acetyltransferase [Scheffersomyces spartinae]|uniref:D-amino-acid N-acetyltransferase n=1 Tax=Scheffersomyces spartinae TaxID=45513 RepID=A0A9P8AKU0_9ASCO|nr:D-amino-acid N-acetyltransferase [Scheffersomyces spartinae]KAG7196173.1 D-amino-acid N-acetyltransferase [Scheffersomyces spartinae]
MSVTIRPIEKKDKEVWLHLWAGPGGYLEFYKSKLPEAVSNNTFERFFDESEPVWCGVAVDDKTGKVIGFATYLSHRTTWAIEDYVYLNDLFVSADCRLHGVGRKLIEYVYAEADKLGACRVYWHTQFENHRAQMLYTKVGFKSGFLTYQRPNSK